MALIDTLLEDACDNKFTCVARTPGIAWAVALQLLSQSVGSAADADELLEDACTNKFTCVAANPRQANAVAAQLLLEANGG